MIDSPNERDPVELLAADFASRSRRGEFPSVSEYAARYPQYAERIEELFPVVAMMEQLRSEAKARREAALRRAKSADVPQEIGDFEIVQEVGRGGMGIVYEAEQKSLGRRVAVKVLPKHMLLLDRHLRRFQREAQTAARLHHTNIVPVFGVGSQDGLHYYVMPLVRGVGLDEIIRELRGAGDWSTAGAAPTGAPRACAGEFNTIVETLIARKFTSRPSAACEVQPGSREHSILSTDTPRAPWSVTRTLRRSNGENAEDGEHEDTRRPGRLHRSLHTNHWRTVALVGVQAADALDYAHAQGTLHRDVKPGNLLVDGNGVVCVADFGLARAVDHTDVSRSGEVVGTLRYMAPEQLRGAADARSDIYALGLTLYELLTLRPAFEDADRRRLHHGLQAQPGPVRPRKINQAIPRDLETIILKCLADEPSKRYQTATALAADLRCFLEDKPIHARRASSVERAWRWCRRNPALAATSALAALLLIAVGFTALTGYVQTRRAYAEATSALARAEATSQLSLEVLEDIYLQLSPDRVWISSDSDPGGEACACIGLRSGDPSARAVGQTAMQVQASRETASLLENLLVFYDRLAEQAGNDAHVMLQSAIAIRRVGDIRGRLGQIDQAEQEYLRAVEKLAALQTRPDADARICTEMARCHNEIGSVRSARLESERAYESHQNALLALRSFEQTDRLPEEYRYELARTFYFLSSKRPGATDSPTRREPAEDATDRWPPQDKFNEYRNSAISILEQLTQENPNAPDYRFLLALCYRPSGFLPTPAWSSTSAQGRQRAIEILEELKSHYPGVADYRYELTATYAWIPVGLFPWQQRSAVPPAAEQSLRKALDESEWLVDHNPTIPHYACSRALILAKLGTVRWKTGHLQEAEDSFRKALETQSTVIEEFPDLPSHNRVLLEFLRLRLGQVCYERSAGVHDLKAVGVSRDLLNTSIENLTELTRQPELAGDRLAWSCLPVAYRALSRVLAQIGESEKAEQAKKIGKAIRSRTPDGRRLQWQL